MKRPTQHQVGAFMLYAFPAYWPMVLWTVAVFIWHTPFTDPEFIRLTLFNAAVFVAAVLMVKKRWWVCLPMIAFGAYLAIVPRDDAYTERLLLAFGCYLILHYAAWGVYVYREGKKK